jgi:hypothetical protein
LESLARRFIVVSVVLRRSTFAGAGMRVRLTRHSVQQRCVEPLVTSKASTMFVLVAFRCCRDARRTNEVNSLPYVRSRCLIARNAPGCFEPPPLTPMSGVRPPPYNRTLKILLTLFL